MLRREVPLLWAETVLFPGAKMPLTIFEERDRRLLEDCLQGEKQVGVSLIKRRPTPDREAQVFEVGTLARILHADIMPDNQIVLVLRGEQRFRLVEVVQYEPYWVGRVELIPTRFSSVTPQLTHLANRLSALLYRYIELREIADKLALADMMLPTDLAALGFRVATLLDLPPQEKQALLEAEDLNELLLQEVAILDREIKRLQQSAYWNRFVRERAYRRAIPPERAVWN